jgi:myb proto-oncogene protein
MGREAATTTRPKLRRGLWSPEEDEKLYNHIIRYGVGCWSSVPKLAGVLGFAFFLLIVGRLDNA